MPEFSLKGRQFVLRHLDPTDVERYVVFFNELGEESLRCRFGHLLARMTQPAAVPRTRGNAENEKALAIFDDAQERIVAIGRCYLDSQTGEAEVAFVVAEAARQLGLGRFLLRRLTEIAWEEGSRSVGAFIATRNAPVVRLLQSEGFVAAPAVDGGDLKLVRRLLPGDLPP